MAVTFSRAQRRELLAVLVWRDVVTRYKRTTLGVAWALAEPLSYALVYFVVFGMFAKVKVQNYPFYLLAGLLPWSFFQSTLNHCAGVLAENGNIIRKVALPRDVLVIAKVIGQAPNLLIGLFLVAMVGIAMGVLPVTPHLLLWIPAAAYVALLSFGLGAACAVLAPHYKDVPYLMSFIFRLATYATPIIYEPSMVPPEWRWILLVNPMTVGVELFHAGIAPDRALDVPLLVGSAITGVVMMLIGWRVYANLEPHIAEVV